MADTVGEALSAGRIEALKASARALAKVIDGDGNDELVTAAVGRLQRVLTELEQLGVQARKGSVADEIKAKRDDRRAVRHDPASAARRGQSRRRGGGNRAG